MSDIIIMGNKIFGSINFSNRGINLGNPKNPGMLLFPFGNLSHTSILYYTVLYVIALFERYGTGWPSTLHKI
jgi:hypothetical protein